MDDCHRVGAVDRDYVRIQFEDVYPDSGYIPLKHDGGIPHRVLALKVDSVFAKWTEVNQSLTGFFYHTEHDDINVAIPMFA